MATALVSLLFGAFSLVRCCCCALAGACTVMPLTTDFVLAVSRKDGMHCPIAVGTSYVSRLKALSLSFVRKKGSFEEKRKRVSGWLAMFGQWLGGVSCRLASIVSIGSRNKCQKRAESGAFAISLLCIHSSFSQKGLLCRVVNMIPVFLAGGNCAVVTRCRERQVPSSRPKEFRRETERDPPRQWSHAIGRNPWLGFDVQLCFWRRPFARSLPCLKISNCSETSDP